MAKSNLQLLQEAIAAGDLEKAEVLAAKLAKPKGKNTTVKAKPKTPSKASKAKVATKPKATAKKATTDQPKAPRKRKDLDVRDMDESSYLAPSRKAGNDDVGGRKFVGADGKEHVFAKRVSMEGMEFVNRFNPEDYSKLPANHEKVDKKLKNLKSTPRPGQRGALRDVANKIEARCVICHQTVKVYPWEAETVDGESSFRCSKKSCVKAR